jgi:hypothetical protein
LRFLPIPLPSGITIALAEVSAEDEPFFRYLMALLRQRQKELGDDAFSVGHPEIVAMMQQIAPLIPLLPLRHGKYFPLDEFLKPSVDVRRLGWLFWGDDCQILELNKPDEVEAIEPTDEMTAESIPIKSSGDDTADLFARILSIDNSVEGAQILLRQYSARFLKNVIHQLNELRKDPTERIKDEMVDRLKGFIDEQTHDSQGNLDLFALQELWNGGGVSPPGQN